MTLLAFTQFSGIAPRMAPWKLAEGQAQIAKNVRLSARTLKPWKNPLQVATVTASGDPSTIYRFGQALISDTQYWFNWAADVDVVKGAISGDATERTYFTHPSLGPRVTNNSLALTGGSGDYPWNSYKLGVPAPTAAPTVSVSGGSGSVIESREYVITYVTLLGEEGPPSPVSSVADLRAGDTASLSGLGTSYPAGYSNISAKRIYRTLSGSQITQFQFVDEIPVTQDTYTDNKSAAQLQEVIPSATWNPPPATAFGICQMANGITMLFDGYDIYASEAYRPHAYPPANMNSTDFKIVGGATFGNYAVVCTVGNPYLIVGSDPSSLSCNKVEQPQACVSKRSIVGVGNGVIYASPDGLVFVDSSGSATVVTENLITRDDWQSFNPSTIHAYVWEGRYIGFYNNGITQAGFVFEPREGDAAITLIDTYATAGYSDLLQDALYLKVGSAIQKWHAAGTTMTYDWRSRVNILPKPENLGAAQVLAEAYPVTFNYYADGVLKLTKTVTSAKGFRLPSGFKPRNVEVEITGTNEVYAAYVASSLAELGQV